MNDPSHPVWPIIKLVIVLVWLTGVLWITASSFDATEFRAIVGAAVGWIGAESAQRWITRME